MACSCGFPACSHVVLADVIRAVSNLTDQERVTILKVLARDEMLKREQQLKVMHLKAELQNLRRKGALRPSADWDNTGPDPDRSCGRCRVELGRVINRGAYCRACRLKVCKSCREYSFRTTDWVCTVCHKRMEIQAASGEWMNEFVRRPSRRRDNRVYVPTAEIIKRTIRRSWTISNPTPRWNTPRNTPEMRPYNSLPRGQDITNYPSLQQQHQDTTMQNPPLSVTCPSPQRHSPARRTHSEDVYPERNDMQLPRDSPSAPSDTSESSPSKSPISPPQRSPRINPLILYAQKDKTGRTTRKKASKADSLGESGTSTSQDSKNEIADEVKTVTEKRVSFDSCARDLEEMTVRSPRNIQNYKRAISMTDTTSRIPRRAPPFHATRSLQERTATLSNFTEDLSSTSRNSTSSPETSSSGGAGGGRDERDFAPLELCDIEPLSGTVFRKVTVRRRRQDMRKMAAVDTGWRRNESDLLDYLAPEGDDYKLVFLSSDSSSKEEDVDDNDSSSTASSFPIDECDWDYFEPGTVTKPVLNWNSPFGSPRVYRRGVIESPIGSPLVYRKTTRESDTGTDDDYARLDTGSPASSDSLFASKRDSEEGSNETNNDKGMEDVALQCKHKVEREIRPVPPCRSCGAPTQYIPIPVPVPIPVPIPTLWTTQEAMKFYGLQQQVCDQTLARLRIFPRNLWPFLNATVLSWPLMGGAGEPISVQPTQSSEYEAESRASRRADAPDYETVAMPENMNESNATERPIDQENVRDEEKPNAHHIPEDDEPICGYLESENRFNDSSSSSTETDDSEYNEKRKSRVSRVYNVNGRDGGRESDDALPSSNLSSCDEDDARASPGSVREDMTSSWSADTDSDDTGTDQKPKRFSKVFVVNRNVDSSSEQHSSSSDSDTSDNDTDTELDCTVILQNIKYISQDDESAIKVVENEVKSTCANNVIDLIDETDESDAKDNVEEEDNAESMNKNDVQYENDAENVVKTAVCPEILSQVDLGVAKIDNLKQSNIQNEIEIMKFDFNVPQYTTTKIPEISDISSDLDVIKSSENVTDYSAIGKFEVFNSECDVAVTETGNLEDSNISNGLERAKYSEDYVNCNWVDNFKVLDEDVVGVEKNASQNSVSRKFEDLFRDINVKFSDTSAEDSAIEKRQEKATQRSSNSSESTAVGSDSGDKESGVDAGVSTGAFSALPCVPNAPSGDQQGTVSSERNGAPPREDIRSVGSVGVVGEPGLSQASPSGCGVRAAAPGVSVTLEPADASVGRHAARYTSLVMITQESPSSSPYQQVSVVTSDTTTFVQDNDVIVQHTNWQKENANGAKDPVLGYHPPSENVTVITGAETLSAFEEGLADDDSWVENISHDEDDFGPSSITEDSSSGEEVTLTCSVAVDNEDELRGYHRAAIDFTLHTIVEESCEESEVEQTSSIRKPRPPSTTDLEKYFFFGLGDGNNPSISTNREDTFSETSSVYSEGLDSLGGPEEQQHEDISDPAELASSRLEKYFLSGFMGFSAERRDSDGSVGSDSEGRPSPEQRRKRLVRARGTGRSHSSSLDNLISNPELSGIDQQNEASNGSENSSSSDSDTYDETTTFDKGDGQFDTVKRKKTKKQKLNEEMKCLEATQEVNEEDHSGEENEDGHKTPQPENTTNLINNRNQQSRDSGFIGSCDDLLKEQRDNTNCETPNKSEMKVELDNIIEEKKEEKLIQHSVPPATSLTRKDSFNNWSSDEETNLMMSKMRQFFKTMIANSQCSSSKPTTPNMSNRTSPSFPSPSLRAKNRCKPPQLVYFENELTRLMKTVPGIRDDQVREIVEYLSSEDTWSDSYDSSDYTSSDLEGTTTKSALQQQISDSCKQIINKFDNMDDEEGDEGDGGIVDEKYGINRETAFVYQKLVASFEKMASGNNVNEVPCSPTNSPTLIARVMHHIGSRLVALMHEVSSGESHTSNSPKTRHYHRRLQQKLSNASSTTTDDDSTSDTNLKDTLSALEDNFSYSVLSRSKSHDLLMGETKTSNSTGSGDIIVEEREASDCERFSWRGSFESALLATDSRNRLSIIGSEGSASASALAIAAKRRSAGDLIFSHKSLSREQLDRVRSCGSIGGASSEDKLWVATSTRPNRRRSSVPDASCGSGGSADGEDDDDEEMGTSLPRNLQTGAGTTNSLPRLPTNTPTSSMLKAQSHHFLPQNAKSARYRPPGFNRLPTTVPKRAVSAPGLQPLHQRRGRRSQQNVPSEPQPKKIIKPNIDDGITDADRKVFSESDSHQLEENVDISRTDLYISKENIEFEATSLKNVIDDEKDSAFSLNEDNISSITDEISVTGSDMSGKKKKEKRTITNLLRVGRKKMLDGFSTTSSSASFEKTDVFKEAKTPEENVLKDFMNDVENQSPSMISQIELQNLNNTSEDISTEKQDDDDVFIAEEGVSTSADTPDAKKPTSRIKKKNGIRIGSIFQSIRRKSKGKKNDDDQPHGLDGKVLNKSGSSEISVPGSETIESEKVISLGGSVPSLEIKANCAEDDKKDELPGVDQDTVGKHRKKFPWRSSYKKDKPKDAKDGQISVETNGNVASNDDLEKKNSQKKTFFAKVGSLKRSSKPPPTLESENIVNESVRNEDEDETTMKNDISTPQQNEIKKKSLFDTLRSSKKEKSEKEHNQTKCTPSIFTTCTNSNIKSNHERKTSSDSIEVNTIASYEGEPAERQVSPIRIIRNDFYPGEVLNRDKSINSAAEEDNLEKTEDKITNEGENESDYVKKSDEATDNFENIQVEADEEIILQQESPSIEKKYGVIDTEDFSESLHTLIDDESPDYVLLVPSTLMIDSSNDDCGKKETEIKQTFGENSLPEGIFRTSCSLSIEGSVKEIEDESSSDTLVASVHLQNIEKSTDTLTEANKGSETAEWVEIANIEDFDESKFNYIYKTTLKNVQNAEEVVAKAEVSQEIIEENIVTQEFPNILEETRDHELSEQKSAEIGHPELSEHEPTEIDPELSEQEPTNLDTELSELEPTEIDPELSEHTTDETSENCKECGRTLQDEESEDSAADQPKAKCICTTLTKVRRSVGELEEGNVKSKIAILAQSEHPIILPFRKDDIIISEAHSSPTLGSVKSGSKSATPSPIAAKSRSGTLSSTNSEWQNAEEDIDRLMVIQGRSSLSSLGLRSDSMASVYSGAGEGRYGTVAVRGQVEFGLQYNYKAGALEIHVKQCKDLAAVDFKRNRSDPYVKVYLLPDKSKGGKRKTKVKKHTLNPVFEETLKFHISLNGLETRTLWLTVWHSDMFGRNDFLGEVMMALENKVFDDPIPKLYNLQERTEPFDDTISFKGDIIVCLKFVPPDMTIQKKGKRSRGTLQVLVKEAKYLTAYKANGASDPFCKSYLLPDKGRNSKQKTQVAKKTINPVWNHTFVYDDVTLQELAERCLELTVWDHDRLASNEFLGGVRFSLGTGKHYGKSVEWMDSTGKEMTLWKSMLERPNFWVEGCLSLRPTLDARTS